MHPPTRTNRSKTGTPWASCTPLLVVKGQQAWVRQACWCGEELSQEYGQDEVVVILVPARVLHDEQEDLALSVRLPSQRPRYTWSLQTLWHLCEIVLASKLAQDTLESELYITGSRVVAVPGLKKILADLILTRHTI